jgi:hypothetical protein
MMLKLAALLLAATLAVSTHHWQGNIIEKHDAQAGSSPPGCYSSGKYSSLAGKYSYDEDHVCAVSEKRLSPEILYIFVFYSQMAHDEDTEAAIKTQSAILAEISLESKVKNSFIMNFYKYMYTSSTEQYKESKRYV